MEHRLLSGRNPTQRLALELQDYVALPITADNTNTNTREGAGAPLRTQPCTSMALEHRVRKCEK